MVTKPAVEVIARPGSRLSDDAAQRIFRVASRLPEDQRNADTLLNLAKDPSNEIHDLFVWDDRVAADRYRKNQARHMLRSVYVRVVHNNEIRERPAFYSVKIGEDTKQLRSYVRFTTARDDEQLRRRIMNQVWRDLEALSTKYGQYLEMFQEENPALVDLLKHADRVIDGRDDAA
jgi:hypothetical protein